MRYLVIDTETGGLDFNIHSLLTVGFVVFEDGKIIDRTEFKLKHDVYCVTGEALKVNNIDLTQLNETPKEAFDRMVNFINRSFPNKKVNIMGHNVYFDIQFLKKFWNDNIKNIQNYTILNDFKWDIKFSHHYVDTMQIAKFLKDMGKLKSSGVSLEVLIDYFNLKAESRHTAMEDATMTAFVYEKLKEIAR